MDQRFFHQPAGRLHSVGPVLFLWGSAYPAIKSGYELFSIVPDDISGKLIFAGYRFFFAGIVLLLFAVATGSTLRRLTVGDLGKLARLGLAQTAVHYAIFYIGLAHTTGAKGAILNGTVTFFQYHHRAFPLPERKTEHKPYRRLSCRVRRSDSDQFRR